MVTVSVISVRSCCVAVGYSDCSVSVKAVSTAARHFAIRHSGLCPTCHWLDPVANDPTRTFEKPYPRQSVSPGGSCVARRAGAPSWTSEVGCGGLASNNMRRHSARMKIERDGPADLTAEDLKDLGVGLVGHRRMLLDAIAALRARSERTNAAIRRASVNRQVRPGPRRAPPSHRDVLRPRRLDGALRAHGP